MKKLSLTLCMILLTVVMVEGTAWIGLRILQQTHNIKFDPTLPNDLSRRHERALKSFIKGKYKQVQFSSSLGWTNKPGSNVGDGAYVINQQGLRATREYSIEKPDDKIRVATFGDSYTFGQEVVNQDTWQAQLSANNEKYEVMNFGLGGHGTDQAYLRYQLEGIPFSPDVVAIGVMTENINRIVNVYRPFYVSGTGIPLTKPRYIIVDEELQLIPNPHQTLEAYSELLENPAEVIPDLGKNDYYYHSRYASGFLDFLGTVRLLKLIKHEVFSTGIYTSDGSYNTKSEAFRLLTKIIESFYNEVKSNGSIPVVMIYPDFDDGYTMRKQGEKKYLPLLNWLKAGQYNFVDLMEPYIEFRNSETEGAFFSESMGHYSGLGNRFVYKYMENYLDNLIEAR